MEGQKNLIWRKTMQIFEFSPKVTIIIFILLWPLLQLSISFLCILVNDKHFNYRSFFYKTGSWENNGEIYNKVFMIRKWKKFLPDGGAIMKGYKKKHLDNMSKENLEKYLIESCRAELQHWLSIFPFWIFGFFAPARVLIYMLIYAVAVNLPCIIAQRYNRPRIVKLLIKMEHRANIKKNQEI